MAVVDAMPVVPDGTGGEFPFGVFGLVEGTGGRFVGIDVLPLGFPCDTGGGG